MAVEDWKTYKYQQVEIRRDIRDEVHEFLTKVFNIYMVKLPPDVFKQIENIRDKLIVLTARFSNENYNEFCDTFSKIYRLIIFDKDMKSEVKNLVKELADRTNKFFTMKGMPTCVRELKYYALRLKILFNSVPLEKAKIVVESEGRVVASAETDASGFAVVEVPEGKHSVYVYKHVKEDEYVYEEKMVEVPLESELVFNIKETKTVTEIARERGGKPLIKEVS
jgi:hypothetical protein